MGGDNPSRDRDTSHISDVIAPEARAAAIDMTEKRLGEFLAEIATHGMDEGSARLCAFLHARIEMVFNQLVLKGLSSDEICIDRDYNQMITEAADPVGYCIRMADGYTRAGEFLMAFRWRDVAYTYTTEMQARMPIDVLGQYKQDYPELARLGGFQVED